MLTATFGSLVTTLLPSVLSEAPLASFVVYGSALVASLSLLWAILERTERKACMKQNYALSEACRQISEQHYRERVQAEERHLLAYDSGMRNILESLERAMLGKPKA